MSSRKAGGADAPATSPLERELGAVGTLHDMLLEATVLVFRLERLLQLEPLRLGRAAAATRVPSAGPGISEPAAAAQPAPADAAGAGAERPAVVTATSEPHETEP